MTIVYLLFLIVLWSFVRFVVPTVGAELNRMVSNLPTTEQRLIEIKNGVVERYPTLREPLEGFLRSALSDERAAVINEQLAGERARLELSEAEIADAADGLTPPTGTLAEYFNRQDRLYLSALLTEQFQALRRYAPTIVNALYRAIATMALALLFSYLILIDQARIKHGVMRLKNSRVGDFYEEAAPPIVRFGVLLGRAIEAQAAIAVLNTLLTLVGLLLLRIPLTAMLSVVVFVCSFVPVLGVLISTTPIVLVALNAGGLRALASGDRARRDRARRRGVSPESVDLRQALEAQPRAHVDHSLRRLPRFRLLGSAARRTARTLLHPRRARRPVPRSRRAEARRYCAGSNRMMVPSGLPLP